MKEKGETSRKQMKNDLFNAIICFLIFLNIKKISNSTLVKHSLFILKSEHPPPSLKNPRPSDDIDLCADKSLAPLAFILVRRE